MAKIGIISPPTLGHVNPLLILGNRLLNNGHEVVFFQQKEMQERIEKASIKFSRLGKILSESSIRDVQIELGTMYGIEAMRYWMKQQIGLFKIWFIDLEKSIESEKIDLLLVDQSDPVGACIADYKRIPFITVCLGLDLDWEESIPPFFLDWQYAEDDRTVIRNKIGFKNFVKDFKPLFDYINKKRIEFGLEEYDYTKSLYPVSAIAQIAQLPSFLDYPRKNKSNIFHNVGPFLDENNTVDMAFPYERLNNKPLVYISLGTILNMRSDVFEIIASSFFDIDVQLVISTGDKLCVLNEDLLPLESIVCSYVPQREILSKAVLCITHGGLNTVMDSLSNGVPLVVIPISFDQPGTAARIKYKGVGEYLKYSSLSKDNIKTCVMNILNTPSYYEKALEMKTLFLELDGLSRAVNIIEKKIVEYV
ncbi:nucleotide disphospho-sugar-binding domain-containing protein [Myroides odoratus]|uniref:nucleotide disphospho-sugar-binding domain-containing protein n=1 Tax=Myroides odoratus TaxID=256 RepID=UPI0039B00A25